MMSSMNMGYTATDIHLKTRIWWHQRVPCSPEASWRMLESLIRFQKSPSRPTSVECPWHCTRLRRAGWDRSLTCFHKFEVPRCSQGEQQRSRWRVPQRGGWRPMTCQTSPDRRTSSTKCGSKIEIQVSPENSGDPSVLTGERKQQQDARRAVVNGSARDARPEIQRYPAGSRVTIVEEMTVTRVTTIRVPGGPSLRLQRRSPDAGAPQLPSNS